MKPGLHEDLWLGLDVGANSVGWALLHATGGEPDGIVDLGVRVFVAGVNIDEKSGKNISRNLKRRQARSRRRLLERRAMRLKHVRGVLTRAGLCPGGKEPSADLAGMPEAEPYKIRAKALDHPLAPYELGYAIYHIAHRRGFLSNRKAPLKDDEKKGKVERETRDLWADIQAANCRTLGEYLSRLDPREQRVRGRYTLRLWYRDEFEAIWSAQQPDHPDA
ncbi:MAG TPA: type II CRISPR RNA-guided endonuclease Cas9, partial [Sumerlaeia bacterium]|nr:type II CRISPR RNA-guided endonuclease Cas9 [Sumerlaeia bacterium]